MANYCDLYWICPRSRLPHLRHGQGRLHIQRRAVPGAEDDGGEQPEGHPAPADSGQDHHQRRQGRRRQDILRRVLRCKYSLKRGQIGSSADNKPTFDVFKCEMHVRQSIKRRTYIIQTLYVHYMNIRTLYEHAYIMWALYEHTYIIHTLYKHTNMRTLCEHYTNIRTLYKHYMYIIRTCIHYASIILTYVHYTNMRTLYKHYTYIIRTLYKHTNIIHA